MEKKTKGKKSKYTPDDTDEITPAPKRPCSLKPRRNNYLLIDIANKKVGGKIIFMGCAFLFAYTHLAQPSKLKACKIYKLQ